MLYDDELGLWLSQVIRGHLERLGVLRDEHPRRVMPAVNVQQRGDTIFLGRAEHQHDEQRRVDDPEIPPHAAIRARDLGGEPRKSRDDQDKQHRKDGQQEALLLVRDDAVTHEKRERRNTEEPEGPTAGAFHRGGQ